MLRHPPPRFAKRAKNMLFGGGSKGLSFIANIRSMSKYLAYCHPLPKDSDSNIKLARKSLPRKKVALNSKKEQLGAAENTKYIKVAGESC